VNQCLQHLCWGMLVQHDPCLSARMQALHTNHTSTLCQCQAIHQQATPVLSMACLCVWTAHMLCHWFAATQAIAQDVGPREMTVRQMLHSAALRSRQPSITPAAADRLVRMSMSLTESPLEGMASSPKRRDMHAITHPPSTTNNGDVERGLPLESIGSNTGSGFRPQAAPTTSSQVLQAGQQQQQQQQEQQHSQRHNGSAG